MKVLFMFSGLPHYYNLVLSRLNNVEDLDIVVVSPKQENQTIGGGVYETRDGINFKCIFLEQYNSIYKKFFRDFDKVIDQEKPDIVITIFFFAYSFLYNRKVIQAMRRNDAKLIYKDIPFRLPKYQDAISYYTAQKMGSSRSNFIRKIGLNIVSYFYREISKKLYNKFDAHVNYVEKAKEIFGSYGVPDEKIFITYNSIDNELINEQKEDVLKMPPILPHNPHRLFHVGRLVEWKRVSMLVDAVADLKNKYPNIELLIIGDGPLLEDIKHQVEKLDLESNVIFLGAIYDPKLLGQYFLSSSFYVLAGMGGLSLNETMAWGLPVVCSVCDGTEKHLVKDMVNGRVFKDGDIHDLIVKLDYMLKNEARSKKMGEQSQFIIDNEINVHTVIKGYLRAFNYVTNNKYKLTYQISKK